MKHTIAILIVFISVTTFGQNVGIGTKDPLSKLHVAGDVRIDNLSGLSDSGLVIHNSMGVLKSIKFTGKRSEILGGDGKFYPIETVAAGTASWLITGNSGTDTAVSFLGTTDDMPLRFRINNLRAGEISRDNISVGMNSLYSNVSGTNNLAIGFYALNSNTASANVAIGDYALTGNTTGQWNTAVGIAALNRNTTGTFNIAIGQVSLGSNETGKENIGVGFESLEYNKSGSRNTVVGTYGLRYNKNGSNNTSVGFRSLYSNLSGVGNVAIGYQALDGNTAGSSNTATGYQSLLKNTTGVSNTAVGGQALLLNTTGVNNTASGYGALKSLTTGSLNTALGMYADVTAGNLTNATAIGYNAKVNANNKVRIGNASVTKIEGQVPFSTPSDGRYKFNVREDVKGLSFILKLRPVTYQFDVDKFDGGIPTANNEVMKISYAKAAAVRRTGFIAQDVERAANQSEYVFSGINKPESTEDHYSLSYEAFVVPLVKGMQEQQILIETQQKLIKKQDHNISVLAQQVSKQQELIDILIKSMSNTERKINNIETRLK